MATLLSNRPAKVILPKLNIPPKMFNNNENNHTALTKSQPHADLDTDTHENIQFLLTVSNVAMQHEDGEPWIEGPVVGHRFDNHHGRSYKIRVVKMGHTIISASRHINITLGTVNKYLRNT